MLINNKRYIGEFKNNSNYIEYFNIILIWNNKRLRVRLFISSRKYIREFKKNSNYIGYYKGSISFVGGN